ncbi:calcium-binding protein [Primorskyibacter aestuariivivens]|uniref:calcium-binding protein n=1 Tax=Primorskyibacter aestuariivivens TaxID=1888912 RepID=UPI0023018D0C|nr:calcium-binding protein [Primorskyibacter aestuariivivens]MDA7430444.1 calcium-binding protein [Primorskyibacter aestuariivivens]
MAVINHNILLDGVTDFTDLHGNIVSWGGGNYLLGGSIDEPNPGDTTTVNVTMSGSNWGIEVIQFGSDVDFTNFADANGDLGREITSLVLGQNSDVDLISTRIAHISTASNSGTHDVSLGSQDTRTVDLRGSTNILTTDTGWVRDIRTRGDDTVNIGSGGARSIDVGDGNNVINVDGGYVDLLTSRGTAGQNNVTLMNSAGIRTLSLHQSTNTITLHDDSRINYFQTSESTNTVTTDARWFGFYDSWNADNTVNIGSGGAGTLHFFSDQAQTQTITASGHIENIQVGNLNTVNLTLGANGAGSVRLGNAHDTVTTGGGGVALIETRGGNDTVTIGSGGAGAVWLGHGNDALTVAGGSYVNFVQGFSGQNNVDILDTSEIGELRVNDSVNIINLFADSRLQYFKTNDSTNTLTTNNGFLESLHSWNSDNTITIGAGGAGQMSFASDTARTQTINAIGHINSVFVFDNQATNLTYGANGGGVARLGELADTVTTGAGFIDAIITRGGNDTVTIGSGGANALLTGDGEDTITTGSGFVDLIAGGNDNDTINVGTGGAINVRGGNGNDNVNVSELSGGGMTMYGGSGIDSLGFGAFNSGVTFSLNTSDWQMPIGTFGMLQHSFENLSGTRFADDLTGSDEDNVINGLGGFDTIVGLDGDDELNGGNGWDQIFGGNGNDTLNGDAGLDTLIGGAGEDLINGGIGADSLVGGANNDTLNGESGFDTIVGGDGADVMNGGNGYDLMNGGGGNDTIIGGAGHDTLLGAAGDDRIEGGFGAEIINGGTGNDTLNGGVGPDTFIFGANSGTDNIEDFQDGMDILRIADHSGGFAGLTINDVGGDLEIVHDGGTIILDGLAGTVLTSADFDFV